MSFKSHKPDRFIPRVSLWAGLLLALFLAGCLPKTLFEPPQPPPDGPTSAMSDPELRRRLNDGFQGFSARLISATDAVKEATDSLAIKRRAVYLKARAIPAYAGLVSDANPRIAFVDVYAFTAGLHDVLSGPKGDELFGDQKGPIVRAVKDSRQDMASLARRLMPGEDADNLDEQINAWLATRKNLDAYGTNVIDSMVSIEDQAPPRPPEVMALTLSPYRILEGIDNATQAVREMTRVGERIAQIAEYSPYYGRWSMELLVYELLETQEVESALAELKTLSRSLNRLVDVSQELPGDVRGELSAALGEVDQRLDRVEEILDRSANLVQETGRLVESAASLAESTQTAANGIIQASSQWDQTLARAQPATQDLQKAMNTLNEGADTLNQVAQRMAETLASMNPQTVRNETTGILNRAAITFILTAALFLVLLFLYRMAARRFIDRG